MRRAKELLLADLEQSAVTALKEIVEVPIEAVTDLGSHIQAAGLLLEYVQRNR